MFVEIWLQLFAIVSIFLLHFLSGNSTASNSPMQQYENVVWLCMRSRRYTITLIRFRPLPAWRNQLKLYWTSLNPRSFEASSSCCIYNQWHPLLNYSSSSGSWKSYGGDPKSKYLRIVSILLRLLSCCAPCSRLQPWPQLLLQELKFLQASSCSTLSFSVSEVVFIIFCLLKYRYR